MSNVSDLFVKLVREQQDAIRNNLGEMQRFSVTLNTYNLRRLDFIAKSLGTQRSTLARDIISKALDDAETILGLSVKDEELTERKAEAMGLDYEDVEMVFSEYGRYLYSGDEPEWFDSKED